MSTSNHGMAFFHITILKYGSTFHVLLKTKEGMRKQNQTYVNENVWLSYLFSSSSNIFQCEMKLGSRPVLYCCVNSSSHNISIFVEIKTSRLK